MANKEKVLDGLAWAGVPENIRVAKIAAGLVRDLPYHRDEHTKAHIKRAVSATSPPHGRGKIITEAVTAEFERQLPIRRRRERIQNEWESYQKDQEDLGNRINRAYAHRFDRPLFADRRRCPLNMSDFNDDYDRYWEAREKWAEEERARDKGDDCAGLMSWQGYSVALLRKTDTHRNVAIAVRKGRGDTTVTYIQADYRDTPNNFTEVAVLLGGPKVAAALSRGKRVITDWAGRKTTILHNGTDEFHHDVETIPWLIINFTEEGDEVVEEHCLVLGDEILKALPGEDDE